MRQVPNIFEAKARNAHWARARKNFSQHDFLIARAAKEIDQRLHALQGTVPIKSTSSKGTRSGEKTTFPVTLKIGAPCYGLQSIKHEKVKSIVVQNTKPATRLSAAGAAKAHVKSIIANPETLPFQQASFDLVVSLMELHWVNDLPGVLAQTLHVLKPQGVFCAAFLGGKTLHQLRDALGQAETEIENGISPRVSPFVDIMDMGQLLTRAGFGEKVVDSDTLTVRYKDAYALMRDLRGMGETNSLQQRRRQWTRRETLERAGAIYHEATSTHNAGIEACFEIIYTTAWKAST